jgi:hypothetical protein
LIFNHIDDFTLILLESEALPEKAVGDILLKISADTISNYFLSGLADRRFGFLKSGEYGILCYGNFSQLEHSYRSS